ncbi:MAG: NAD(P)H-hydrate dehydratase [Algoriphagus sp.]|nr:NAD(P)H-hydrate dehydratase [Algoriphagus sp.]
MKQILSATEIAILDQIHLKRKGISNHAFMELVAQRFVDWFQGQGYPSGVCILVCVGSGNNGGDGVAIARILFSLGYCVEVATCFSPEANLSPDCAQNFSLLPTQILRHNLDFSLLPKDGILIDAYLGLGCTGPLREEAKERIQLMNSFGGIIISLDLPSGLPADSILPAVAVKADLTVTLGFPKLALLLPEHAGYTGELVVLDIGFEEAEFAEFSAATFFLEEQDMLPLHRRFHRFVHKGDLGKILLVAGSKGKMGAAILASKAAFRTGSGLVTCLLPSKERGALATAVPEAMCIFDEMQDFAAYDAIGIGPGLGLDQGVRLKKILSVTRKPVVLDADALNCLAKDPSIWDLIPKGSVLTPHMKEFDRLFGPSETHLERMAKAKACCLKYDLNLVLKGANSLCSLSDGRQVFNSTGSKYMATAGMGDALTGMLTSYLGQGYSPENAVLCGVFHHGLAGELAGEKYLRGTVAQDLIEAIPETYRRIGLD